MHPICLTFSQKIVGFALQYYMFMLDEILTFCRSRHKMFLPIWRKHSPTVTAAIRSSVMMVLKSGAPTFVPKASGSNDVLLLNHYKVLGFAQHHNFLL